MSPLEHHYRRLLRVLPRDHRVTRGEELLGLLLDLDEGRSRPSARQTVGLIGLAIRLRLGGLPAAGALLFSAFLVAYGTMPAGQLIDDYTGAVLPADLPALRRATPILLALALAQLAMTVAWLIGARRTALIVAVGWSAWLAVHAAHPTAIDGMMLVFAVAMLVVLALAVRQRWNTPRPRWLWLATVVLALIAWKTVGEWERHGMYYPILSPTIGWTLAALAAATVVIVTRRHRWPMMLAAALVGFGAGQLLPSLVLQLAYGRHGWLTSLTLGTAILAGVGKLITRRPPDRPFHPRPPERQTS